MSTSLPYTSSSVPPSFSSPLAQKSALEREYAASLQEHSLRGFIAARDEYFARRRSPSDTSEQSTSGSESSSPPLQRSTIRAPGPQAYIQREDEPRAQKVYSEAKAHHPRMQGRKGTPIPAEMQMGLSPLTSMQAGGSKSKSDASGSATTARDTRRMFGMTSL